MSLASYKNIILHAGIHKTGSSFIQKIMSDNAQVLAKRSVHYPQFVTKNAATHGGNHSIAFMTYREPDQLSQHLSKFIDLQSSCDTLLFSAEELSREPTSSVVLPRLRQEAPNATFRAIVYLRRQDHLIESVYSESVKRALHGDISKAAYQLDFRETLKPFSEVLGQEAITIRPYNRSQWPEGNLAFDFLSTIGLSDLWADMQSAANETLINPSFPRAKTFLLSLLRSREAKRALLEMFKHEPLRLQEDKSKYFLSPDQRKHMLLSHAHIFSQIAEMFEIADYETFFDLNRVDDDEDWQPFTPPWRRLSSYLALLADYIIAEQQKPRK